MSPYESGELTDSIFLILLATLEPIHGYRIMQVIADMTSGSVQIGPATMYTTLRKLSDAGWIEEVREDDSKILYRITTSGDNILRADVARRRMIMTIVETTLGEKED
ncbi:MAG: PadR family transcriptional regulator [Propionibacteriaceae bacterium]|jgi:DNA-binding PadR family transcriptional regulator|nr:PadR family transcriptional regulator [Propionibacteriaceae bacterium]